MAWPDIFFRGKTPKKVEPAPTFKAASTVSPSASSEKTEETPAASGAAATSIPKSPEPRGATLPGTGGTISRPLAKSVELRSSPEPTVSQAMAEADSMRALGTAGGTVRIVKRITGSIPDVTGAEKAKAPETLPAPVIENPTTPPVTLHGDKNPEPPEAMTLPVTAPAPPPAPLPETPKVTGSAGSSISSLFRRKTRMADVARIIVPDKQDESVVTPSPLAVEPAPTDSKSPVEIKPSEPAPSDAPTITPPPFISFSESPKIEPEKKSEIPSFDLPPVIAPVPTAEDKAPLTPPSPGNPAPEIPKPESTATSVAIDEVTPSGHREFVLTNGERILGHVLSETPEAFYVNHNTLGVLTIPRSQIAKKPIEIILINGDRIVGDLIAESPDCLFIRHASLGMLSVPHSQRSKRVVEAILKNGDRILGEILAETENFTVIRSATLGTVAVQHVEVALLNRRVEQVKALPSSGPTLENKPVENA